MVEFAFLAPLLCALLFGIVESGRLLYVQQALLDAAREGARLAAVEGAESERIATRVQTVLGPIHVSSIEVSGPDDERLITVSVRTTHAVPSASLLGWLRGPIELEGHSTTRFEN